MTCRVRLVAVERLLEDPTTASQRSPKSASAPGMAAAELMASGVEGQPGEVGRSCGG
jgi:hypothetical protein